MELSLAVRVTCAAPETLEALRLELEKPEPLGRYLAPDKLAATGAALYAFWDVGPSAEADHEPLMRDLLQGGAASVEAVVFFDGSPLCAYWRGSGSNIHCLYDMEDDEGKFFRKNGIRRAPRSAKGLFALLDKLDALHAASGFPMSEAALLMEDDDLHARLYCSPLDGQPLVKAMRREAGDWRVEVPLRDGYIHGVARKYFQGRMYIEESFESGLHHGPTLLWSKDGDKLFQGEYWQGLRVGLFQLNLLDGNPIRQAEYDERNTAAPAAPLSEEARALLPHIMEVEERYRFAALSMSRYLDYVRANGKEPPDML